jgi:cytoskeleton protein RodZ
MELFGEKLREVREKKKYTIDQVARETRISKQYLIALEEEDFQIFPGETYLIGFLRSYAEYLDLDPDHYVNLYKNIKIQEQPIPFNELLDTKKKISPRFIGLAAFFGITLAAVIGVVLFFTVFNEPVNEDITKTSLLPAHDEEGEIYRFNDEIMTEWFKEGDIILVALGGKDYPVRIMTTGRETDVKIIENQVVLTRGIEKSFDLNDDGKLDINLIYNDLKESENGNEVNLGFYKINVLKLVYKEDEVSENKGPDETGDMVETDNEESAVSQNISDTIESGTPGATEQPPVAVTPVPREEPTPVRTEPAPSPPEEDISSNREITGSIDSSILLNNVKIKEDTRNVIMEAAKPELFTLHILFREHCNVSYQLDEKSREYRFFLKDDEVDLSAAREMMLWISNANAMKATIGGNSIVMGKAGQVVTKLVYWRKDETSGKYSLEIASVY